MAVNNWIMDIYDNYRYPEFTTIVHIHNPIMIIHTYFMDIHNSIICIQNSIMGKYGWISIHSNLQLWLHFMELFWMSMIQLC